MATGYNEDYAYFTEVAADNVYELDESGCVNLCEYCWLHGAEDDGYCSDVCRRSMELLRAAGKLVEQVENGKAVSLRRLARAVKALR